MNNKVNIKDILLDIERPARYLGNELNTYHKDTSNKDLVRFGFSFPDSYEVGMSYMGLQILYNILNEQEDIFCERIFSPWVDMEEKMRERNIPMFALESREPISNMDFLAFTLQYELSYTNILNILDMGNISILAKDRTKDEPFVLVGGPCAYNVEPISDFVDIVSLGEGEEVLIEVVNKYKEWKKTDKSREDFLYELARDIEGIYIPSLYDFRYKEDGTIKEIVPLKEDIPKKIKKRIIKDMSKAYFPEKIIVPFIDVVHNRVMLEVFRGCIRGCRFCQAGMIYRPVRERNPEFMKDKAKKLLENTGYEEISLSSLSTSDYSGLDSLADYIIKEFGETKKVSLSLPSLRLDNFSLDLANRVQKVRKTGLTFAPEAGSQRLRDVINKGIEEEHLENACRQAFENGWKRLKYYFMMGLPTETYEDLDGIVKLAEKTVDIYKEVNGKLDNKFGINVSTSSFVPKPFTPFQWHPQDTIEELREKQHHLIVRFKNNRNIRYMYHDRFTSFLEAVIARGDRRLGKVIYTAFKKGAKFDGWEEHFNFEIWKEAFEEENVSMEFYANRKREYDEIFPWDIFDVGVSKEFLIRENENAKQAKVTPNCREKCSGCGVNIDLGKGLC
ncbi:MAG: TIGR03960 family B12-binding radical SAM protein [Peptostreptococcaceae bacterium]|jgi:radical SAM family uncharacterized protein|nr:TIGR03960 family B12-binding radical SAM protein [Peptostreptococcaceae bacterium]